MEEAARAAVRRMLSERRQLVRSTERSGFRRVALACALVVGLGLLRTRFGGNG